MIVAPIGFQFTPLREGRRKAAQEIQRGGAISIHAPPRGATRWQEPNRVRTPFQFTPLREGRPMCGIRVRWRRRISIHAPPRGATAAAALDALTADLFQFTPLREGRPERPADAPKPLISIHAPPRGATTRRLLISSSRNYFNSRPSARGDIAGGCGRGKWLFQFTPLREGRRATSIFPKSSCYFNSRPSARGDAVATPGGFRGLISIHAPPRGATDCG